MPHITLRAHLIGNVTDFCVESNLSFLTPELLVDLIVRLSRYQEEGVKLSPHVYLTDDIDSLVRMLPDGEKMHLGTTTPTTHGIREMLKTCAPIATRDWRIRRLKADSISLDSLHRKAEVVKGMLCCDGISLFDERARLLGYRCFVSISQSSGIVGGARKRAFAALKRRLHRGLSSVFIQSQDGLTEFEDKPNG